MNIEIIISKGTKKHRAMVQVPDGWRDLTPVLWRSAIALKVSHDGGYYDGRMYKQWFKSLIVDAQPSALSVVDMLEEDYLAGIVEQIEWIREIPEHDRSYFSSRLFLHGPQSSLSDFNMKQFGLAQQFIYMFGKPEQTDKQRVKHLRSLMAVTWRLSFIPWKSWMCDVYNRMMPIVPRRYLERNLFNVWGMIQTLPNKYEWVYDSRGDSEGPDHGFRSLLESLAGEKFGDYYQVQKAMLHDVMVHLDHNAHRVSKMKENSTVTNTEY